jgi:Protein of unknown function (DUF1559)
MPRRDDEYDDFDRDRDGDRGRGRERRPPRRKNNTALIVVVIVLAVMLVCGAPICIGLLLPAVQKVRESANRMNSSNNLKQISLAAYSYNQDFDELPGNTYTSDGKPLLSWRVHILPYIDAANLYSQFKLDEPWDGPNNIRLLNQMPPVYQNPRDPTRSTSKTNYRGFSSPGAIFERRLVVRLGATDPHKDVKKEDRFNLAKLKDPRSDTILVVEARDAVEWTKPDDLDASPGRPFPPLGGFGGGSTPALAGFVDGSVRTLPANLAEATLRALVTHSGGEVLPSGWDNP